MATFVMQYLGCEVSAINTVHYSARLRYNFESADRELTLL